MDPQIDNSPNNSENEANVNNDKNEIVIRLDEQAPLNDPDCKHKFSLDGDTIGDTRAWKCEKCHRGIFLPKHITKVT